MSWYDDQLEGQRNSIANERERFHRECATPKDDWGNNIDGYINHLIKTPSYENVGGKINTIRGFKSIEKHFHDYLEDDSFSCYHQCRAHGYYDWMVAVKNRYLELRSQNKLKDLDVKKAEREEREYWVRYYNNNPQFRRPEGI